MATCEPLNGNADFYGLGIRIGIYLQWASAWLSLFLDPESAQSVLDANSLTLFAVTIATLIAASRNAPAIDMYIMLQMLIGFPISTLSSLGFRLWLMTPRRLDKLLTNISSLWQKDVEKRRQRAELRKEQKRLKRQRREDRRQALQRRREQRQADANSSRLTRNLLSWQDAVLMPYKDWESWEIRQDERRARRRQRHGLLPQMGSQPQPSTQRRPLISILAAIMYSYLYSALHTPLVQLIYFLWHLPVVLPLRYLSVLKFPGLSWSGVLWRATAVALLMAYNLAYWFNSGGHGVQEPVSPGCGPATVFMFSIQLLEGPMVTLGRTAAIFFLVIAGPPTYTLLMLTIRIFWYSLLLLYRDTYFFVTSTDQRSFGDSMKKINGALGQIISDIDPFGIMQGSLLDILQFMGTGNDIRFSDVIKVIVSLGLGKPVKRQSQAEDGELRVSRAQTMPVGWSIDNSSTSRGPFLAWFCIAWNLWMVLSMAWIITSLETTIRWNNIQGVNTIDSTGQLIPFVIGCVSVSQVLKKLMLLALGKIYPDWVDTDIEFHHGRDGFFPLKIVRAPGGATGLPGSVVAAPGNTAEGSAMSGPRNDQNPDNLTQESDRSAEA